MSDFTAVAPPQSNISASYDPNSAFADAVQRARQIAAKINPPSNSEANNITGGGTKRPLEDSMDRSDGSPDAKKLAAVNDPFGAQLAALAQQRVGMNNQAPVVEEWSVPDKMVGLIIGRGGEQISRLQAESGCKIQMAPECGGLPDRSCTLTGPRHAIEKAKEMINQIISRGGDPNQLNDGHLIVELMIPGPKVGLVIGKGGETIRSLQERANVKMVMIQDGPQQSMMDKPLRITGEKSKCEYAKRLVLDLITEKELENVRRGGGGGGGGFGGGNEYGGGGEGSSQEVMVPKQAVGVVIGKQGDMIKRIQQETGARVQFQQPHDDNATERVCLLTGNPEQVHHAASFIGELIQSVLARDQQNMGRGRGRGRGGGGFDGAGGFGPPGGPGMGRGRRGGEDMHEVQYPVPANKCGLVIGKGGESIRQINQQSGAHVELSRAPPPNPVEKVFIIRGSPQQIEHAQQLINERIGGPPPGASNGQGPPSYPTQYPQPYQQPPPPNQPYAPQGWGNAYQHWQNQTAPPNDPSKAAADANAAAWAAYYAQYYGQQGGQPPQQQPPAAAAAGAVPAQAPQQAPQGAAPGGAQPDYSQAWIEYYRSLGMYREAEMIEHQTRTNQTQQAQQPFPPGGGGAGGAPPPQSQGQQQSQVAGPPGAGQPGAPQPPPPAGGSAPPGSSYPPGTYPPQQPYGAAAGAGQQYAGGYNYAGYAGAQ
ncbi:far upstream element-binding protein 1-like isoform X2 [Ornithodoros turicata]|uniref:far upstream element-binding protein 1-like isoform X2 n=1 Tax=Ornithodoros turicata TaxID=34597 RepID=UPI00313A327A